MTTRWAQGALEILTVGLPFCAFKLVTGIIALHTAFAPLGYALLALGTVDLVLNASTSGATTARDVAIAAALSGTSQFENTVRDPEA